MKRPNLLLIQTDQQKASSLDLYNRDINYIRTEHISELAANGVVFENGYCPYPLCVPSRIAMMCGQSPNSTGHIGNAPKDIAGQRWTLFDQLKSAGYHTMLVGKDHCYGMPGKGETLEDRWTPSPAVSRVFDEVYSTFHGRYQTPDTRRDCPALEPFIRNHAALSQLWGSAIAPWTAEETQTAATCNAFIARVERQRRAGDQPFACWLSICDPHEPYQAPQEIYDRMADECIGLYPSRHADFSNRAETMQFFRWYFNAGGPVPDEVQEQLIRVYLAMCKNVDVQLGRVFACLKANDLWENTLIIYTSDHGDLTGELGLLQKFNCAYDGAAKIPLIMAWPGATRRRKRVDIPVNLVDLPATICGVLGIDPLPGDQGTDLSPVLLGDASLDKAYTVVESGVPGLGLTCRDIANFDSHRYHVTPRKRGAYDPPHRYAGRTYAVRTRRHKLITREGQCNELYDMQEDPWETTNMAGEPGMGDVVQAHLLHLVDHLTRQFSYPPTTRIAKQDDLYPLGGDMSWDACIAEP